MKKENKEPVVESKYPEEWVLDNLLLGGHISVVPVKDIKKLHGMANYETYMTARVQREMNRTDVRVLVKQIEFNGKVAYNARVLFL